MKDDIDAIFKRIISEPVAPCKHNHVISIPAPGVFVIKCTRCGEMWRGRMYISKEQPQ